MDDNFTEDIDSCHHDENRGHLVVNDDDALDYIVFAEMTRKANQPVPSSGHGCFLALLLPVLFVAGVFAVMVV